MESSNNDTKFTKEPQVILGRPLSENFKDYKKYADIILKTDPDARTNLVEHLQNSNFTDEIKIVDHLKQPILIAHSTNDILLSKIYFKKLNRRRNWKKLIIELNNHGHSPHIEIPDDFNTLLDCFFVQASLSLYKSNNLTSDQPLYTNN